MTVLSPPTEHRFNIRCHALPSASAFEVEGSLDWQTVHQLTEALQARPVDLVVLDLTRVERIDSAGTGGLISLYLKTSKDGTAVVLVATEPVKTVLDRVGLSDHVLVVSPRS